MSKSGSSERTSRLAALHSPYPTPHRLPKKKHPEIYKLENIHDSSPWLTEQQRPKASYLRFPAHTATRTRAIWLSQ